MKRSSTIFISSLITLAAGYLLGSFVGINNLDKNNISGNIGNTVSSESAQQMELLAKKLSSDEQFRSSTLSSFMFVNSRVAEFKTYTDMSVEACANIPELQAQKESMEKLAKFSKTAETQTNDALQAVNGILGGDRSANIEELTNNAILSYMLIQRSFKTAKDYVSTVDEYIKNHADSDTKYLAYTRDLWAEYGSMEAMINGDETAYAFWNDQKDRLTAQENEKVYAEFKPEIQQKITGITLFNKQTLKKHGAHKDVALNDDVIENMGRIGSYNTEN